MKRREFVARSAAMVLGAGLGGAGVVGAQSSSSGIRIGVVGTGGRGTELIRKLSTVDGAVVVAVCDDYEPHLLRAADAAGPQAKPYTEYAKMLRESSPQVVIIATPLYLHHQQAMEAIAAGADVFCEKTMCYSTAEAIELADAVRRNGTVFQVGLQRHASPIYQQAKVIVDSGRIGRITAIKSQWHRNNNWRRPVPVERGHPSWPTLERRLNWRLYREYSRGLLAELGSHQMDVANWMLGALPVRAVGSGGVDYLRDGREVYDNVYCIYDYELRPAGGDPYTVRVTYSSLQTNAFEGASELIMGEKGTLLLTERQGLLYREPGVDDVWNVEEIGDAAADAATITSGKTLNVENDPWAHRGGAIEINSDRDSSREQLVAFLDNVRRRHTKTICDVVAGMENTATTMIGYEAVHEGGTVELPKKVLVAAGRA
jgi:predicted dehydrogenase